MDKNDVGAGFIPLKIGDTVQEGDQRYVDFCWIAVPRAKIGKTLARLHWPMRRKAAVDPGPGYRILENGELILPGDEFKHHEDPWDETSVEPGTGVRVGDQGHRFPYRRRVSLEDILHAEITNPAPAHLVPYLKKAVQEAIATSPEIRAEWIPKPFTPNKYTRDLLSLDGRRVPVDVYSVSGALAVAPVIQNEEVLDALFHARKKLLAPGQRGAKGVLQDLKEARQSLDRAIRVMEGG